MDINKVKMCQDCEKWLSIFPAPVKALILLLSFFFIFGSWFSFKSPSAIDSI